VRVRIDEAWYDATIGSVYFGVEFNVFKLGLVSWVGLVANELNCSTLLNDLRFSLMKKARIKVYYSMETMHKESACLWFKMARFLTSSDEPRTYFSPFETTCTI
jgi:hypothetical protein